MKWPAAFFYSVLTICALVAFWACIWCYAFTQANHDKTYQVRYEVCRTIEDQSLRTLCAATHLSHA